MWAADPETGEAGARRVTALIEGEGVKDLVTVSTGSGSVVATAGHPFWGVSDAAWVDAGDLAVGDAVLQAGGATRVVTAVVEVSRPAVVHNLTVADLHTYFVVVGDAPTLVHNCSGALADDAVEGASNTYVNITNRGSKYPNFGTSAGPEELAESLVANGWTRKVVNGGLDSFVRGDRRWTVRPFADSYPGWSADLLEISSRTTLLKLRLGYVANAE